MTDSDDTVFCGGSQRFEHDPRHHDGSLASHASAPAKSRVRLLIQHRRPSAEHAVHTELPKPLRTLAMVADHLGIRVQLIRCPGSRVVGDDICAGWTVGTTPCLRKFWLPGGLGRYEPDLGGLDLEGFAAGVPQSAGVPVREPMFLVCAHGRRDRCCSRYGGALARVLAERHPGQVWDTIHVGGHKFAANSCRQQSPSNFAEPVHPGWTRFSWRRRNLAEVPGDA